MKNEKTEAVNVIPEDNIPENDQHCCDCTAETCECDCESPCENPNPLTLKRLFDYIDTNRIITIRYYQATSGGKREQVDVNFGETFSSKFENLQKYGSWAVKTIIPVYISAKRQNAYLIIMDV